MPRLHQRHSNRKGAEAYLLLRADGTIAGRAVVREPDELPTNYRCVKDPGRAVRVKGVNVQAHDLRISGPDQFEVVPRELVEVRFRPLSPQKQRDQELLGRIETLEKALGVTQPEPVVPTLPEPSVR